MTLSIKSLTIILSVISLLAMGIAVFDNLQDTNDRSLLRSSNSDISKARVLPNSVKNNDQALQNIEILNQQINGLQQKQKELFEKIDGLVEVFKDFDEKQNKESSGQLNFEPNEEKYDMYYRSDEEIIQNRNESYQMDMANQEIDGAWREHAHGKVESMFDDESFSDSSIVSVDCRSTLCELDLSHENESAAENFMEEFPAHMAWNNESFIETKKQSDGSIRTKIYFSRDGQALPSLSEEE